MQLQPCRRSFRDLPQRDLVLIVQRLFRAIKIVVLDAPVTYTRYVYDSSYNLEGYWNLHTGLTGGWANTEFAAGASFGGSYTLFTSNSSGYTFGANAGIG